MRRLVGCGLLLLATFAVRAQRPDLPGGYRTYGSPTGFGNILFPGMGNAPSLGRNPFSISDPGFAHRLSGVVSGLTPYTGVPARDSARGRRWNNVPAVGFAYPVFVGGYVYGTPEPAAPQNVIIINPPAPAPATIVSVPASPPAPANPTVRQNAGEDESGVHVFEAPGRAPAERPATEPVMFLIALKDSSVYTAVAYWVEGDALHYVTSRGTHNQTSLDLVDRELSEKLNQGRKVELHLPAAKTAKKD